LPTPLSACASQPNIAGRRGRQLWANDSIYNTPMLEPGRKRHPLSILVLCSVGLTEKPGHVKLEHFKHRVEGMMITLDKIGKKKRSNSLPGADRKRGKPSSKGGHRQQQPLGASATAKRRRRGQARPTPEATGGKNSGTVYSMM
jgi:hypothetical protein